MKEEKKKYNYLVADDEFPIIKIITDILNLRPDTSVIYTARDGSEALDIYRENPADIIITDILMPKMNGIELIKKIHELKQDTQIIVVSAFSDIDLVREAMRNGAYDYVLKPFSIDDLMLSLNRTMERLKFIRSQKNYVLQLEEKIRETTENLHQGFLNSLYTLVNALEARDEYTKTHSENVSSYAVIIGRKLELPENRIKNLEIGGFLHDIGKIGIPDSVLLKPGHLNREEYEVIKIHPVKGSKIIQPSMQTNQDVMDFVLHHHEHFDGTGYPDGLKGSKISLTARIADLADAYDAMTSKRLYKPALTKEQAIDDIKQNSGKQFDPEIAKVFLEWLEGEAD